MRRPARPVRHLVHRGRPVPAGLTPPYEEGFVEDWLGWFQTADYAVLSVEHSSYVPWSPELQGWFDRHYVLVGSGPRTYVYYRVPGD